MMGGGGKRSNEGLAVVLKGLSAVGRGEDWGGGKGKGVDEETVALIWELFKGVVEGGMVDGRGYERLERLLREGDRRLHEVGSKGCFCRYRRNRKPARGVRVYYVR